MRCQSVRVPARLWKWDKKKNLPGCLCTTSWVVEETIEVHAAGLYGAGHSFYTTYAVWQRLSSMLSYSTMDACIVSMCWPLTCCSHSLCFARQIFKMAVDFSIRRRKETCWISNAKLSLKDTSSARQAGISQCHENVWDYFVRQRKSISSGVWQTFHPTVKINM